MHLPDPYSFTIFGNIRGSHKKRREASAFYRPIRRSLHDPSPYWKHRIGLLSLFYQKYQYWLRAEMASFLHIFRGMLIYTNARERQESMTFPGIFCGFWFLLYVDGFFLLKGGSTTLCMWSMHMTIWETTKRTKKKGWSYCNKSSGTKMCLEMLRSRSIREDRPNPLDRNNSGWWEEDSSWAFTLFIEPNMLCN